MGFYTKSNLKGLYGASFMQVRIPRKLLEDCPLIPRLDGPSFSIYFTNHCPTQFNFQGLGLPPNTSSLRKSDSRYFCSDLNRTYNKGLLKVYNMTRHRPIMLEYGRHYAADSLSDN